MTQRWNEEGFWPQDILATSASAKDNMNNGISAGFLSHMADWKGNYGTMKESLGEDVNTLWWSPAVDNNKVVNNTGAEDATGIMATSKHPELAIKVIEKLLTDYEVGLQYVHAQAMAALGGGARAWDALARVTPPLLQRSVPCATPRQSNVYFSSSDAAFPDRASFEAGFERIRTGEIPCREGWRLYSSGPGIYIARLLGDLLGLRGGELVKAPVLPEYADGAVVRTVRGGEEAFFVYRREGDGWKVERVERFPE